jgi:hypothetical protein
MTQAMAKQPRKTPTPIGVSLPQLISWGVGQAGRDPQQQDFQHAADDENDCDLNRPLAEQHWPSLPII